MDFYPRTDLALEARDAVRAARSLDDEPDGVTYSRFEDEGFSVERVEVLNTNGAESLCKPIGTYLTITTGIFRENEQLFGAAAAVGRQLGALLPKQNGLILVVGLGNDAITPDALGPLSLRHIVVTRHLCRSLPNLFGGFRPVATVEPGVLAATGVESAQLVDAVVQSLSPAAVIVIDALAAGSHTRLGTTVQLATSGVSPGSGVGNRRDRICAEALGVPVIAVGVPTVIDAAALAGDTADDALRGLFVTPRDIDRTVRQSAKLLGYAVNLAVNCGLTFSEIEQLTG